MRIIASGRQMISVGKAKGQFPGFDVKIDRVNTSGVKPSKIFGHRGPQIAKWVGGYSRFSASRTGPRSGSWSIG
jgi:hypothetical protein